MNAYKDLIFGFTLVTVVILLNVPTTVLASEAEHFLKAAPNTVAWGYYDGSLAPVLTVDSGDVVNVETLVTGARMARVLNVPEVFISPEMSIIDDEVAQEGAHLLVGPIAVRGAKPGDVLEIRILEMGMADNWAVNLFRPGGGLLPSKYPYQGGKFVQIDPDRQVINFDNDIEIPVRPFFGSLGVAPPPILGRVDSGPPGAHTGNLDNKELVAGSTLYIPVHVQDAMLFVGDGHAAQGDGEVNGTAFEASLTGRLQLIVRKDLAHRWPRAETPTHFITMGLDEDLEQAAKMAVEEMIDYLVTYRGLNRDDAYVLCSAAVDLRITQLVDGTKGVHAMLPKTLFVGDKAR